MRWGEENVSHKKQISYHSMNRVIAIVQPGACVLSEKTLPHSECQRHGWKIESQSSEKSSAPQRSGLVCLSVGGW